jgi:hypothetical protein
VNPAISTARNSQGFTSSPVTGTVWNSLPFIGENFSPIGSYQSGIAAGIVDIPPAPNDGHWLVRVVPEPSSAVLFVLGAAVVGLRRRNSTKRR